MVKVTKEKYGRDPWDNRDAFRIRVTDENGFNDFHLKIKFDGNSDNFNGNNKEQVLILLPTGKGLTEKDLSKRNGRRFKAFT